MCAASAALTNSTSIPSPVGVLKVAAEAEKTQTYFACWPDTGERYLSTSLFADVRVDMNEEELKISRSTPSRPVQNVVAAGETVQVQLTHHYVRCGPHPE